MKKLQRIFIPLIALAFAAGCQKEHAPSPTTPDAQAPAQKPLGATTVSKDALTGRWAINAFSSATRSSAGAPAFSMGYKGQEGDYYQFNVDGTLLISQGGTVYKGGYELAGSQLTLLLPGNNRLTMQLQTLSSATLELARTHSGKDQELTESRTFTRQ